MGVLIDLLALSPFKLNGIQDVHEGWGGTVEWQLLKPNLHGDLAPTLILNLYSCQPVFVGIGSPFLGNELKRLESGLRIAQTVVGVKRSFLSLPRVHVQFDPPITMSFLLPCK